jgi:hypothetical protein
MFSSLERALTGSDLMKKQKLVLLGEKLRMKIIEEPEKWLESPNVALFALRRTQAK